MVTVVIHVREYRAGLGIREETLTEKDISWASFKELYCKDFPKGVCEESYLTPLMEGKTINEAVGKQKYMSALLSCSVEEK